MTRRSTRPSRRSSKRFATKGSMPRQLIQSANTRASRSPSPSNMDRSSEAFSSCVSSSSPGIVLKMCAAKAKLSLRLPAQTSAGVTNRRQLILAACWSICSARSSSFFVDIGDIEHSRVSWLSRIVYASESATSGPKFATRLRLGFVPAASARLRW
eukprot:Amastigsp_a340456_90.p4 type:complete len:156 gc:universal Amastigsp_a340456_90:689-1156(+)